MSFVHYWREQERALRGRRAMRMRRVRQPKHITAACTSCLPTRETACTPRRQVGDSCTPPQPCTAHAPARRHSQVDACLHVHDYAHTRGARRSCADSKHLAGEPRRGRRPRVHWRAHHLDTRSISASVYESLRETSNNFECRAVALERSGVRRAAAQRHCMTVRR